MRSLSHVYSHVYALVKMLVRSTAPVSPANNNTYVATTCPSMRRLGAPWSQVVVHAIVSLLILHIDEDLSCHNFIGHSYWVRNSHSSTCAHPRARASPCAPDMRYSNARRHVFSRAPHLVRILNRRLRRDGSRRSGRRSLACADL